MERLFDCCSVDLYLHVPGRTILACHSIALAATMDLVVADGPAEQVCRARRCRSRLLHDRPRADAKTVL